PSGFSRGRVRRDGIGRRPLRRGYPSRPVRRARQSLPAPLRMAAQERLGTARCAGLRAISQLAAKHQAGRSVDGAARTACGLTRSLEATRPQACFCDTEATVRRLVIRPGAIGDFIVSLPALECLKTDYLEVWAASPNVPLARFADRARPIASTGLDLLGIADPPAGLIGELRRF